MTNGAPTGDLTPEQRVEEAVKIVKEFEEKLKQLEEQNQDALDAVIKEAEAKKIEEVKALIDEILGRIANKTNV